MMLNATVAKASFISTINVYPTLAALHEFNSGQIIPRILLQAISIGISKPGTISKTVLTRPEGSCHEPRLVPLDQSAYRSFPR